jgi:ABC-2 type transporter
VDEKRQRRGWFVAAAALLAVDMYGVAETLANRIPRQEYVGAVPALAIVPWFFAGSLFAITALPAFLTWIAKILPLTHALALMRFGLLDDGGAGLEDIWGMNNTTATASLSLAVVAVLPPPSPQSRSAPSPAPRSADCCRCRYGAISSGKPKRANAAGSSNEVMLAICALVSRVSTSIACATYLRPPSPDP